MVYSSFKKNLRKKLGLNEDSPCNISLEQDQSEYGHEVPEEFEVLLDQDEEGQKIFRLPYSRKAAIINLFGHQSKKSRKPNEKVFGHLASPQSGQRETGLQTAK